MGLRTWDNGSIGGLPCSEGWMMNPFQAIGSCLRQYVGFSGRAPRSEFWWWVLFLVVLDIALQIFDAVIIINFGLTEEALEALASSAGPDAPLPPEWQDALAAVLWVHMGVLSVVLLPSLAVSIRRLHDTDWRGWWLLLYPVAFVLSFFPGTQGGNRFGPNPLGTHGKSYR